MDYKKLEAFAVDDRDVAICRAMEELGSQRKAAKSVGMSQSYLNERLKRIKKDAALHGYEPDRGLDNLQPSGQILSGISTLYDESGNVTCRWVKTKAEHDEVIASMKAIVDEMCRTIKPESPVDDPRVDFKNELMNLYVLTDAHLGMYAHREEGGENWDLKIAESSVNSAFDYMIANTPCSEVGLLCNLGDLLHSDGLLPVTPTSHNVLDQDSRFYRVIRTAIRVLRATVKKLLGKHKKVVMLNCQGNHDLASSLWLQEAFCALYEDEPRVEVVVSPLPYYAVQHGDCLLAFAHGNKKRGRELADLVTGQFRDLVGKTKHTYIHTGHLHQQELVETPSATVEQHPTIAARDSHASHGGWLSKRGMQSIIYHKEHLEISRCMFRPKASGKF